MSEESTPLEETIDQQPKVKIARWLQRVIGVIVPVLSLVLTLLIAHLIIYDFFTPWVPLGSPPGGVIAIVNAKLSTDGVTVFVGNAKGYYKYSHDGNGKWMLSSNEEVPMLYADCQSFAAPFTRPPGKVVDEFSTTGYCFPEEMEVRWGLGVMPRLYRFAILDDGTVWGWLSEPDYGQAIRLLLFLGFIGYMLGGILWFLFQYFNRTIQPPPKQKFGWRLMNRIVFLLVCSVFVIGFL